MFFFLLFFAFSLKVQAQNKIDSLNNLLEQTQEVTTIASLYLQIGEEFRKTNPDSAFYFFNKIFELNFKHDDYYQALSYHEIAQTLYDTINYYDARNKIDTALIILLKLEKKADIDEKKLLTYKICKSYELLASILLAKFNYNEALEIYFKIEEKYSELNDFENIIFTYFEIGNAYTENADYENAIKYYLKALEFAENKGDKFKIAKAYNNIAIVYYYSANIDKALEYFEKALKISDENNDIETSIKCVNNIAVIYFYKGEYEKSLEYYLSNLKNFQDSNNKSEIITCYINIGATYYKLLNYEEAILNYNKAIEISEKIEDYNNLSFIYSNISSLYYDIKNYKSGLDFAQKALEFAFKSNSQKNKSRAYQYISQNYESLGKNKEALENYKLYKLINDSIFNQEKIKNIAEVESKYQYEKREQENILLTKEKSLQTLTIQKQKIKLYLALLVISLVFALLIILLFARKKLKDLNNILENQKEEILATNEELVQQKEEITAQSEELLVQTEELEKINLQLEKLSIVASETDNAVIIMDKNGNFEWINEGFSRLYGYNFDELINILGKNVFDTSSNSDIYEVIEKCKTEKKSVIYESQTKAKNGKIIWVQTTLTPILNSLNNVEKFIAIESDIRKLKQFEKELELKNEHITASIRYAKTIQNAILPIKEQIDKCFENFIIFRPKDIVSGDFYWFNSINLKINEFENLKIKSETNNFQINEFSNFQIYFIAVLDCTGHGVP